MTREVKREFNSVGELITITVQLKYEDMEVSQYPESCYECPFGFMQHGCGREVPLSSDGRPKTCKLKQVNIKE